MSLSIILLSLIVNGSNREESKGHIMHAPSRIQKANRKSLSRQCEKKTLNDSDSSVRQIEFYSFLLHFLLLLLGMIPWIFKTNVLDFKEQPNSWHLSTNLLLIIGCQRDVSTEMRCSCSTFTATTITFEESFLFLWFTVLIASRGRLLNSNFDAQSILVSINFFLGVF